MSSIDSSGGVRSTQSLGLSNKSPSLQDAKGKSFGFSVSKPSSSTPLPSVKPAPNSPLSGSAPDFSKLVSSRSVSHHTPTQSYLGASSQGGSRDSFESTSSFDNLDSFDSSVVDSFSDVSSLDSLDSDESQATERKDTRNRKQRASDAIRSKGRKFKSALFGSPKRFLTGKNWKKVPPDVLKEFPKGLREQVEDRNAKIERLSELKEQKRDWQQFERQFGKELDLAESKEAPKSGKFKIPDTGEEFVFSKSQSRQQRTELLGKFQKAFQASAGHKAYLQASAETRNIDAERAALKKDLSESTKDLRVAVDKHFDKQEARKHAQIDKTTEARHEALHAEKNRVEEGYDKLVVHYQDRVDEATRDLSDLRHRRDNFRDVEIPAKKRDIERLERQMEREVSLQKKKFKSMPKKQRAATSQEAFLQPVRARFTGQIQQAQSEVVRMQQEVNSYKDDRALLRKELKTAEKNLKKAIDGDALGATLKKIDKRSRKQDKVARKEHDHVPDEIKKERKTVKKAIRGR